MLKILNNQSRLETLAFPDGESFVKFDYDDRPFSLLWKYENDGELIQLAQLVDVLGKDGRRKFKKLYIPYFPHARQDRPTTKNQPFSLSVFCNLLRTILDGMNTNIYSLDIHSSVIEDQDLLNCFGDTNFYGNFYSLRPESYALDITMSNKGIPYDFLIRPDEGAEERTNAWATAFSQIQGKEFPIIKCKKTRDPSTGSLGKSYIPDVDLSGCRLLVVDDIATGATTHINLGKALKEETGASQIDLWVSHASFTRGIESVLAVFDRVFCTDSLKGATKAASECKEIINFDCLEVFNNFKG